MTPLVQDMVQDDPTRRQEKEEDEIKAIRVGRNIGHFLLTVGYVLTGKSAVLTAKRNRKLAYPPLP